MTRFGYTLMTEQSGPRDLVRYAAAAEGVGFDFEVMSDHYSPWLTEQGHSPYAWSVLGAVAQDVIFEAGDHVVQRGRTQGTVRATGVAFDIPEVHVWTLRDGKVAAAEFYIDTPAMLAALEAQQ